MDEADIAQNNQANINDDAMKEHERRMEGMEMVSGNFECEDCGRLISSASKARLQAPMLLCGSCSDFYRSREKIGKLRGNYE